MICFASIVAFAILSWHAFSIIVFLASAAISALNDNDEHVNREIHDS